MDLEFTTSFVGAWLLTYLLHSSVLLAAVALATRALGRRRVALQEVLWRGALLAGIATATLQVAVGWQPLLATAFLGTAPAVALDVEPLADPVAEVVDVAVSASAPLASGETVAAASIRWVMWLVAAYCAVALLGLLSVAVGWVQLQRRLANRRRVRRGPLVRQLLALRRHFGLRVPVRLSVSAAVAVPVATGLLRPEICLPAEGPSDLDTDQQRAILAHELAHLRGRDPLWLLVAHTVERALWLQPLNRVARRRLHELAEYRCDDQAIAHTREPMALASCLVEVAGWSARALAAPTLLPAMASAGSQLEIRVHRVLDGTTEPAAGRRGPRLAATLLLLVALGLPSFRFEPAPSPIAEEPAPWSDSLDPLVDQLAALAELQRQVTDELAGLRADLAQHSETETWAAALTLLEERTAALHQECGRLRADLTSSPELPSPTRR